MTYLSSVFLLPLTLSISFLFFFNDTATTEIYTLSLHDALPILKHADAGHFASAAKLDVISAGKIILAVEFPPRHVQDRKSTRLNSSHSQISYAVFCLKKKKKNNDTNTSKND